MKIFLYSSKSAETRISYIINRGFNFSKKDYIKVSRILEDVRKRGDKALIKYANQFDSPSLSVKSIRVTSAEIAAAKNKGKHLGRPKTKLPDEFQKVYTRWKSKEITAKAAMKELNLKPTTFYNIVKSMPTHSK